MAELKEVGAILDTGKVELEDLQAAMQAILFHQCLYEDWPHAPSYRLLVRHIAHVQPILAAFGYGLRHHPVAHMLVLEPTAPVYGLQMARLKKDESAVLIVLRLLYNEGISALDEYGRVEATTDDIHDRLKTCGEEPPQIGRLLHILRMLQRKGLVRVGDFDSTEQLTVVTIMPGVTILVSDVYVEAVIQWLEARALARLDTDAGIRVPPGGTEASLVPQGADDVAATGPDAVIGDAAPNKEPKADLPADLLSAIAAYRDGLGSGDPSSAAADVAKRDRDTVLEEDTWQDVDPSGVPDSDDDAAQGGDDTVAHADADDIRVNGDEDEEGPDHVPA